MKRGISFEAAILASLPATATQIMDATAAARSTVFAWMPRLRAESKVHIKSWRRTKGQTTPVYALGEGKDAARPARMTGATYSKRHYRKHRRDLDKEIRASATAAHQTAKATLTSPQNWLSALGG